MIMATKILAIAAMIGLTLFTSGCTSKQSLLVPGNSESDCADKTAGLGVCGTPFSVYKHRSKIKRIYHEEGENYRVTKGGKIYNTETGEEVIPGVKPEGSCGDAICVGCDEANDVGYSGSSTSSGGENISGSSKHPVKLSNRAFSLETPQNATILRDLGRQQTIWIAPGETAGDDLVEAHRIHVVIRDPHWIIGEAFPKKTRRGVAVPTPLAAEVLSDNHEDVDRTTMETIYQYVQHRKGTIDSNSSKEKVVK